MNLKLGTKDLILRAAEAEFAAHGLGGARVETIASRAGVNNALPFYHFGSKAELYEAVIERIMTRMEELYNRRPPSCLRSGPYRLPCRQSELAADRVA